MKTVARILSVPALRSQPESRSQFTGEPCRRHSGFMSDNNTSPSRLLGVELSQAKFPLTVTLSQDVTISTGLDFNSTINIRGPWQCRRHLAVPQTLGVIKFSQSVITHDHCLVCSMCGTLALKKVSYP